LFEVVFMCIGVDCVVFEAAILCIEDGYHLYVVMCIGGDCGVLVVMIFENGCAVCWRYCGVC
jgi:hypothetical protein